MLARALSLAALGAALAAAAPTTTGSVRFADGAFNFVPGVLDPTAAAWGSYTDMKGTASGFGQLTISTGKGFPDTVQTGAAGFLEGALTADRIATHWVNVGSWIRSQFKSGTVPASFQTFFETQDAWSRANVAANTSSPIWRATGVVTAQFDGLVAGYAAVAPGRALPPISVYEFQQMGGIGDLLDLIPALSPTDAPAWEGMTDAELMDRVRKTTHCSALVKVNGDLTELYFSHAAWFIYTGTTRIFKHYNFALSEFGSSLRPPARPRARAASRAALPALPAPPHSARLPARSGHVHVVCELSGLPELARRLL